MTTRSRVGNPAWRIGIRWGSHLTISAIVIALLVPATPALAGTTPYKCANAGCKYGKARAAHTSFKHDRSDHRGATASGTCDPTNDVVRWRVERLRVYENGVQRYTTNSPFGWHTNCALKTYSWHHDVIRDDFPSSMYTKTHWEWDAACAGCDFDEWIRTYSY